MTTLKQQILWVILILFIISGSIFIITEWSPYDEKDTSYQDYDDQFVELAGIDNIIGKEIIFRYSNATLRGVFDTPTSFQWLSIRGRWSNIQKIYDSIFLFPINSNSYFASWVDRENGVAWSSVIDLRTESVFTHTVDLANHTQERIVGTIDIHHTEDIVIKSEIEEKPVEFFDNIFEYDYKIFTVKVLVREDGTGWIVYNNEIQYKPIQAIVDRITKNVYFVSWTEGNQSFIKIINFNTHTVVGSLINSVARVEEIWVGSVSPVKQ